MTEALCLDRICQRLEARYGCHTILLYGSRARGEARADSDFDVAGFRDAGDAVREARDIEGFYLDAWVYPTARAEHAADLLHLRGGRVLREREGLGTRLLARLETLAKEPPPPLPAWDRELRRAWIRKTVARTERGDVEGRYRRHGLLSDLLDSYFTLRDRRYPGPRDAFLTLKQEDPETLAAFERAFDGGELRALAERVLATPPPPTLAFRPVNLARDRDACVRFRADSYAASFGSAQAFWDENGADGAQYLEWLAERMTQQPTFAWHLWHGERLVGQMELGAHRREPNLGYVNLFYLIPDYRGLGFGPALDAHAGGVFRQQGLTTAQLQVGGDNARARRFYAKLGWRDLGESQPPQPRFPGLRTLEKTWP